MVHASCGTAGSNRFLYCYDTGIICSHHSTKMCRVSHCRYYNNDTGAIYSHLAPESGSYRIVWGVVLLVMADQDAFESSNSQ